MAGFDYSPKATTMKLTITADVTDDTEAIAEIYGSPQGLHVSLGSFSSEVMWFRNVKDRNSFSATCQNFVATQRAFVTLDQRQGKTKTSVIQCFSSIFHWPKTEHAQLHRKLINNNFVRFSRALDVYATPEYDSLRSRIWRTIHWKSLCLDPWGCVS